MPDRAPWLLALLLLASATALAPAAALCDCSELADGPRPVCGDDGLTYLHSCLANCAGVSSTDGPCRRQGGLPASPVTPPGSPAPAPLASPSPAPQLGSVPEDPQTAGSPPPVPPLEAPPPEPSPSPAPSGPSQGGGGPTIGGGGPTIGGGGPTPGGDGQTPGGGGGGSISTLEDDPLLGVLLDGLSDYPARRFDAATVLRYTDEGLRCVGAMRVQNFDPSSPLVSQKALSTLPTSPSAGGTTMMADADGFLYVAPPVEGIGGGSLAGPLLSAAAAAAAASGPTEDGWALADAWLRRAVAPTGRRLLDDAERDEHFAAGWEEDHEGGEEGGGEATPMPSRRLSAIFGTDTRREIRLAPKRPYSSVGHLLRSTDDGRRYQCTGAMVGPYVMLTAAHCIVDRTARAIAADNVFTAGQTFKNLTGLGTAKGVRAFFFKEFLTAKDAEWVEWDIALVVLQLPLGSGTKAEFVSRVKAQQQSTKATGGGGGGGKPPANSKMATLPAWPPGRYGYDSSPEIKDLNTISAGYPGDKLFNSLWRLSCTVTDDQPGVSSWFANYCPIAPGQSGAPLVERRIINGRENLMVRALISFELCGGSGEVCGEACCDHDAVVFNGALKISDEFKRWIDRHREKQP